MCKTKEYFCDNLGCVGNSSEPGQCPHCGGTLQEVEMVGDEDTIEGLSSLMGVSPRSEKPASAVSERVKELMADWPQGKTCPKCGCMMVHYRLWGYRCAAGCPSN